MTDSAPTNPTETDEELKRELRKIIVGAMERGNMYYGYVASAEFNAEAVKVVDTYLPMAIFLFHSHHNQLLDELLRKGPKGFTAPGMLPSD
ncbi:MAG: hypothetical protein ACRD6Q_03470, partial [Nitrososphaeraceae archaeon]